MKNLYRINFHFTNKTKDFDRYFIAENDVVARKHFLHLAHKELITEAYEYEEVVVPPEHNKVTAYYDGEIYMKAELYYLPDRWPKASTEKYHTISFDDITAHMSERFPISQKRSKAKK